jgi:gas vesicle protein
MSEKNKGAKKSGLGLLIGVAAGTVLGVLFAPKKGKVIRENFKKELKDGGTGLNTVGKNFAAMGKDIADTTKNVYESPGVQKPLNKGIIELEKAGSGLKDKITGFFKRKPSTKD